MGTETVDGTAENMALLRAAYASVERGDLDASVEMLTENFIANVPAVPEPLHGREIWRSGTQAMLDAFPDLRITVEDMFGVGDKIVVRAGFRGTHRGDFQGVPATNREVSFRSIEIYRFEGAKIAEEWVAPDMLSLMRQISTVPGR
ncbi:ester cyclase [Streptomyces luteolus]|uniref:Ester cyclase n=1 Tax=Streptomyces luteolus TaxID=3043615 RepID=A0ABT6T9E3_9ACTN|nr:ester cyclase [Streptomyces sp. B-S-A12]MDI3424030.1 ester cyclase [Streptomyces sp. B-S-A12]